MAIMIEHATTKERQRLTDPAALKDGRYGKEWTQIGPTLPDGAADNLILSAGTWIEDPSAVERTLVAQVKATNEALVRGIYSTNFGKQKKYSRKQQETLDYRALPTLVNGMTALLTASALTSAFAALPIAVQRKKFRFAMADAAIRGEPDISAAIGRFESAIDTTETKIAAWEAIEQAAVARIKAAPTAAAKRAAYAAIDWSWQPT